MKITKLVLLFNYGKLLLGIVVSAILLLLSTKIDSSFFNITFKALSFLIILNIIASVVASYILYDKSDLYKLNKMQNFLDFDKSKNAILIHASFDPLSPTLEKKYPNLNLTVCDIFENRHEHDSGIKVSKKVFPPNPEEIIIVPNKLPFPDKSQDMILAITAIHEILSHNERVLFFKEAQRILKKDGLIILSEQFRDVTNFAFFNIGAFHFLSKKQWEKAISEVGLKIVENRKITPFANMLILKSRDI